MLQEDKVSLKTQLWETIFKTNAAQADHGCCMCVFGSGSCGGRRFPVIPFMQPKPEQLIGRAARPLDPSFLLLHVVQFYLEAGSSSECSHAVTSCPSEFMGFTSLPSLLLELKSLSPW